MKILSMIATPLVFGSAVFLTGCLKSSEPYSGKTAVWFESHPEAVYRQLEWCANHGVQHDEHFHACITAANANSVISAQQLRESLRDTHKNNGM